MGKGSTYVLQADATKVAQKTLAACRWCQQIIHEIQGSRWICEMFEAIKRYHEISRSTSALSGR